MGHSNLVVVGSNPPKPFLKWVGGKRQLIPELLKYVPAGFKHYYEPFIGGGALFFALRARGWTGAATLGDANERLVRTYLGVRNDVDEVIRHLRIMHYDKEEYLATRAHPPDASSDDTEMAAWFIYVNKCGFNGLYRVNSKGGFNVPFGRYDNPTLCDEPGLRAAAAVLKRTTLKVDDFERGVRAAERGDLIYFDPPYIPVSQTADFTSYTAGGFTHEDQLRLRDCALRLKKLGAHVILSNADVEAVHRLYAQGFVIKHVEARRNINSAGSKRGAVGEVIIT
jgi:DNA adenine methylase